MQPQAIDRTVILREACLLVAESASLAVPSAPSVSEKDLVEQATRLLDAIVKSDIVLVSDDQPIETPPSNPEGFNNAYAWIRWALATCDHSASRLHRASALHWVEEISGHESHVPARPLHFPAVCVADQAGQVVSMVLTPLDFGARGIVLGPTEWGRPHLMDFRKSFETAYQASGAQPGVAWSAPGMEFDEHHPFWGDSATAAMAIALRLFAKGAAWNHDVVVSAALKKPDKRWHLAPVSGELQKLAGLKDTQRLVIAEDGCPITNATGATLGNRLVRKRSLDDAYAEVTHDADRIIGYLRQVVAGPARDHTKPNWYGKKSREALYQPPRLAEHTWVVEKENDRRDNDGDRDDEPRDTRPKANAGPPQPGPGERLVLKQTSTLTFEELIKRITDPAKKGPGRFTLIAPEGRGKSLTCRMIAQRLAIDALRRYKGMHDVAHEEAAEKQREAAEKNNQPPPPIVDSPQSIGIEELPLPIVIELNKLLKKEEEPPSDWDKHLALKLAEVIAGKDGDWFGSVSDDDTTWRPRTPRHLVRIDHQWSAEIGTLASTLVERLNRRETVVFLDGLDEAGPWLDGLLDHLKKYPCTVVAAGRPYGFADNERRASFFIGDPQAAPEHHIVDLDTVNQRALVDAYFADDRNGDGTAAPMPNAQDNKERVGQLLRSGPAYQDFAKSGFLLTVLCFLVNAPKTAQKLRDDINRAVLYELLLERLIWTGEQDQPTHERDYVLGALAKATWEAFEDDPVNSVVKHESFRRTLKNAWNQDPAEIFTHPANQPEPVKNIVAFIAWLVRQRILIPTTVDTSGTPESYLFAHRTLLEYLAAQHLANVLTADGSKGWDQPIAVHTIKTLERKDSKEPPRVLTPKPVGEIVFWRALCHTSWEQTLIFLSHLLRADNRHRDLHKAWERDLERRIFVDGPDFINSVGVTDRMIVTAYALSDVVAVRLHDGIANTARNRDAGQRVARLLAPIANDNNSNLQQALLDALKDKSIDDSARGTIAAALAPLANHHNPNLQDAVLGALMDDSIHHFSREAIAAALVPQATDNNPTVQDVVLAAIKYEVIRPPRSEAIVLALIRLATNNNPMLQQAFIDALHEEFVPDRRRIQIARALAPLANDDNPKAQEAVLNVLRDSGFSARVRGSIVEALAPLANDENPKAQEAVLNALREPGIDADVRRGIAHALAPLANDDNPKAQEAVLNVLLDTGISARERGCIAQALAPLANDNNLKIQHAVLDALRDTSIPDYMRKGIAEALTSLAGDNPNLQQALLQAVRDTDLIAPVRACIVLGLAPAASDERSDIHNTVFQAMQDDGLKTHIDEGIAFVLAPLARRENPRAREVVIEVWTSGNIDTANRALFANKLAPLASDSNPEIQEIVLQVLQDEKIPLNTRAEIAASLAPLASDSNPRVQEAVLRRLSIDHILMCSCEESTMELISPYKTGWWFTHTARALALLSGHSERVWAALRDLADKWRWAGEDLATIHSALTQPRAWERWLGEIEDP